MKKKTENVLKSPKYSAL